MSALLFLTLTLGAEPAPSLPEPLAPPSPTTLRLSDALARSLANVQTVKANVAVQNAAIGRFEALKHFVPLGELPQLMVGFRRFNGSSSDNLNIIFPDVTGGTPLVGRPRLDHAELNRVNFFFPLDPSGQITALPIAEEGIRARLLMEQLVRRSQVVLAAQHYYEAKQLVYGIRTARLGLDFAGQNVGLVERKLREKQAHDVELTQARTDLGKSQVLLADLDKEERIAQRRLSVILHESRLLVPQEKGPLPIRLDGEYCFLLDDADVVDIGVVPDFPCSREDAIERAKRNRLEVRILIVGLRIARLQQQRDKLRLCGLGRLPLGASFKNTSAGNGGVAFGAIFGATYDLPLLDIGLWANLRRARLDVTRSQLDLEQGLLDVSADAGNSWDRWQQAQLEWEQRERELRLRQEYLERQERLFEQKQAIQLEVVATRVNVLQADANRWTAWFNLQLARLDVLRATELLLDYIEKAGIAPAPSLDKESCR